MSQDPLRTRASEALIVETTEPSGRRAISENVRKAGNLLLVGHGSALLFIFNASVNATLPESVKVVAWIFAVGLVLAFMMQMSVFAFEQTDLTKLTIAFSEQDKRDKLKLHTAHGSVCYQLSALAFVIGLVVAINFL